MSAEDVEQFVRRVKERNPDEPEFHQAVQEVVESVWPMVRDRRDWRDACVLERMVEPDRVIGFRVCWQDDRGRVRVHRAWRVQFNGAIGPYKGGLRFTPDLSLGVLKFLGFEQTLKNSLTGLPLGGAKGGADFAPKGCSDWEVMRFCQALMTELHRYLGEDVDVPAGDIGVGGREIGYLFGQYKRVHNRFAGVVTGKGEAYGGIPLRPEATGYGLVYFVEHVLDAGGDGMRDRRVAISGSGHVALYAAEKAIEHGARVVTLSDTSGFVHVPGGIDAEQLAAVEELKLSRRGRLGELAERFGWEHRAGERPWGVPCDVALPCATQNELDADSARALVRNGCRLVAEGANMPCTLEAVAVLREAGVVFAPGKAANAGGVAVSGLEAAQNAHGIPWMLDRVDEALRDIMTRIHAACAAQGRTRGGIDYLVGANRAGFAKVADAMVAQGIG